MNSRVVIAGTSSGVGKTTISIGLMAALTERGYDVQPYKVGPDYIDPGFHSLVTGNQSRNLDSFFLTEPGIKETFNHSFGESDLAIVEGVMGLFDGKKGTTENGSTAEIAKILGAPVVLVIDAQKMARSAAAVAYGYKNFDGDLNLAGVILNNLGSQSHYQLIKNAFEAELDVEVLGYLPRQKELELPERHLGLVPTSESEELEQFSNKLSNLITEHINLDKLISLADDVAPLENPDAQIFSGDRQSDITLGVAYDEAFNFYYQDNLDLLASRGVNLEYFSPVTDDRLPEVDGLYLGGGFPESFLADLAANKSMQESIQQAVADGLPTYAECGGLMYLTEQITDDQQTSFPMVGVIPVQIEMTTSLVDMGYVTAEANCDNLLLEAGQEVKGHQFHYSKLVNIDDNLEQAYQLFGGRGSDGRFAGIVTDNLLASYLHLHFASQPQVVDRFLKHCQEYKGE
jgi:cobyrinic acid a,c-diamide synthase